MSAVRRKPNRPSRASLSSPYARPVKKSSWSLSGLLSYFNPLRLRGSTNEESFSMEEEVQEVEELPSQSASASTPAHTLSQRGHQLAKNLEANGRVLAEPPMSSSDSVDPLNNPNGPTAYACSPGLPSVPFTFSISSSPAKNLDVVSEYLAQHVNKPITAGEVKSLVSLLQQSKPAEASEPFRFESRPPTTPPRSKSPSVQPGSSAHTPRTLSKNPNGTYTWKGAGSARTPRSKNSFASPAFRTPRSTPNHLAAKTTNESAGGDAKRRRLGDSSSSSTQSQTTSIVNQIPFPLTATPTTSRATTTGPSLKPATPATPPRLRTPTSQKPTAPANPSPLRQAWSDGSPSGGEPGSPQRSTTVRQTETAKHVTELVNSLKSQDKILDVRNPYEAASPVKRRTTGPKRKRVTGAAKKPVTVAATPKEDEASKVRISEMSARAVVEATLPEGSKRSRPPPDLEKSTLSDRAKQSEEPRLAVEEGEDDFRAMKRSKPSVNGHSALHSSMQSGSADMEVQSLGSITKETKEASASSKVSAITVPPSQPGSAAKMHFGPKSSIPKEPSKLRFSMQVESASSPSSPASAPVPEIESSPKSTPLPPVFPFTSTPSASTMVKKEPALETLPSTFAQPAPAPPLRSARDAAKTLPLDALPAFTFSTPSTLPWASAHTKVRDEAKAMPNGSLPTYDLTSPITAPAAAPASTKGFDWNAAGMKPAAGLSGGEWICGSCMLKNKVDATDKCTICDAPRPGIAPPVPKSTFNWAAAGLKPPTPPAAGEWTCGCCSCKNPPTVTDKCTVCDEPKPGAMSTTSKAVFDWAAAGMKPPAPAAAGEWTCGTCNCKNPATAKMCTVCDAERS